MNFPANTVYVLEETGHKARVFSELKKAKVLAKEIAERYNLIEALERNECFFYNEYKFVSVSKTQVE